MFCKLHMRKGGQTNKHTSRQTDRRTDKHTTKWTNRQTPTHKFNNKITTLFLVAICWLVPSLDVQALQPTATPWSCTTHPCCHLVQHFEDKHETDALHKKLNNTCNKVDINHKIDTLFEMFADFHRHRLMKSLWLIFAARLVLIVVATERLNKLSCCVKNVGSGCEISASL